VNSVVCAKTAAVDSKNKANPTHANLIFRFFIVHFLLSLAVKTIAPALSIENNLQIAPSGDLS